MPKTTTAYQCNYCDKIYKARSSTASHEKKCPWRVDNHACATCANRVVGSEDCGPCHVRTVFTCSVYGTDLGVMANLKTNCPGWAKHRNPTP